MPTENDRPSYERFLKDVSEHEMTVLQADGVYRHIRFANPKSFNMSFQITTVPGTLVYTGDMVSYTFQRIEDMFQLFRLGKVDDERYRINPQYWAEKIVAKDRHAGVERFSETLFREAVSDAVEAFLESNPECDATRLREEVEEELLYDCGFSTVEQALERVSRFVFHGPDEDDHSLGFPFKTRGRPLDVFPDFYERPLEDFSYHYIWCCYAIVWAIEKYDA
jgi:hypothetical protein